MISQIKRRITNLLNRNKSNEEIFSKIYKNKYWGGEEGFYSGEGTYVQDLELYIQAVVNFIKENKIESVIEIGCGDFHVASRIVQETNIHYTGIDVVPDLVSHLNNKFGKENIRFLCIDASSSEFQLPHADLCIIRQVLQHLNNDSIQKILQNTSHIPQLLVTEHIPLKPELINADKPTNGYIRLQNKRVSGVYLDKAPYNKIVKEELLRIRLDDKNYDGELIPAELVTQCIQN
jgi:SAM-dependent methyltransferase